MEQKRDEVSRCYDFTNDGECSRCGACCSTYLPMTMAEFKALKRWARKHRFKPIVPAIINGVDIGINANCPFLDLDNHKCVVYDIRPEVCQKFNCHDAVAQGCKYKVKPGNRAIHNLRAEIFNEEMPSFMEFEALKDYIDGRKNGKSED